MLFQNQQPWAKINLSPQWLPPLYECGGTVAVDSLFMGVVFRVWLLLWNAKHPITKVRRNDNPTSINIPNRYVLFL